MTTDKSFVSAQMDSTLVESLRKYADAEGITRSAAIRRAIKQLVATKTT